jgi:hypothetical protein
MDPLSIIASILTVGGAVRQSLKIVKAIRGAPAELQMLLNEVADLTAVSKNIEAILQKSKRNDQSDDSLSGLVAALSKTEQTVQQLDEFVHHVLVTKADDDKSSHKDRVPRRVWLKARHRVIAFRSQICKLRGELNNALHVATL